MIDIHTHILPGVDDGVKNKKEALKVAQASFRQGIKKIVATPHYLPGESNLSFQKIEEKVAQLQDLLAEQKINLELLPGVEAYLTSKLPKKVEQGVIKGVNNSQYILIELPMHHLPGYTDNVLYNLRVLGYTPIIAHPERYRAVRRNPNLLYQWISKGSLAQLNAGSLLGMFGSKVKETAQILVEHNLVQLVGSDLHGINKRGQCLKLALRQLATEQGDKYLANAQLVINNQKLDIDQPQFYKKKKIFNRV